ncbi:MAG: diadenylate cyclase CdaA [Christensenellales bacterium]
MGASFDQVNTFFWNIFNRPQLKDWLDILIISVLIYQLFMLTRETRASQVLTGLAVLIFGTWVSSFVGLTALNWVLMSIINNGSVVLIILFQPEFRRALERLGRGARTERFQDDRDEGTRIVTEVTQSLLSLSRRRVGALMVFEQKTGLKDFVDTGTAVDSLISGALISNIFEPNTPLHDGAVIVRGERIMAAGCVLSLSEQSNLSRDLGTRHRAGLGVSESTDAIVLIVSEETGIISLAQGGKLTRHLDADGLTRVLSGMYRGQVHSIRHLADGLVQKARKGWQSRHDKQA